MKKKALVAALAALALTINASSNVANSIETNIDGATKVGNHTYTYDPQKVSGDVGYGHFGNYNIGEGDIVNANFKGKIRKDGQLQDRDINTFIHLVDKGVNINGVLNSVRDGQYFAGKTIFIAPGGFAVGASGVVNVGHLQVATPTDSTYNNLLQHYNNWNEAGIRAIGNIGRIKQERNGDITINGVVNTQLGMDLQGRNNIINGKLYNAQGFDPIQSAHAGLFNALVNAKDLNVENNYVLPAMEQPVAYSNSSNSGSGMATQSQYSLATTATTATTTQSEGGIISEIPLPVIGGDAPAQGTTAGTEVSGGLGDPSTATTQQSTIAQEYTGKKEGNITIVSGNDGKIIVKEGAEIINHAGGADVYLVGNGQGGVEVNGKLASDIVAVKNNAGNLVIGSKAYLIGTDKVQLENNGNDLTIAQGAKLVNGFFKPKDLQNVGAGNNGSIYVANKGVGELRSDGDLSAKNITMINKGSSMTVNGNLAAARVSSGDGNFYGGIVALNNYNGDMTVGAKVQNAGTTAVINRGTNGALTITEAGSFENAGLTRVQNYGKNGMTINGEFANAGDKIQIVNTDGKMTINNRISNKHGNIEILGTMNSTGVEIGQNAVVENEYGNIAIQNDGYGVSKDSTGLDVKGQVRIGSHNYGGKELPVVKNHLENAGDSLVDNGYILMNNYSGNMNISGQVANNKDGHIALSNKYGANNFTVESGATITSTASDANKIVQLKHDGSGDMTVNGTVNNDVSTRMYANQGHLTLGSKVSGQGDLYVSARDNAKGLRVTEDFNAVNRDIKIRNYTGAEGFVYSGSATTNSPSGTVALYNAAGKMVMDGKAESTAYNTADRSVKIHNDGEALELTNRAQVLVTDENNKGYVYNTSINPIKKDGNAQLRNVYYLDNASK